MPYFHAFSSVSIEILNFADSIAGKSGIHLPKLRTGIVFSAGDELDHLRYSPDDRAEHQQRKIRSAQLAKDARLVHLGVRTAARDHVKPGAVQNALEDLMEV